MLLPSATEQARHLRRQRMSLFSRNTSLKDDVWKGYERIVGFDTMPDAEDTASRSSSYTLQVKAKGYTAQNIRARSCVPSTPQKVVSARSSG